MNKRMCGPSFETPREDARLLRMTRHVAAYWLAMTELAAGVVVGHEGRIAGVHFQRLTAARGLSVAAGLNAADRGAVEIPLQRHERIVGRYPMRVGAAGHGQSKAQRRRNRRQPAGRLRADFVL